MARIQFPRPHRYRWPISRILLLLTFILIWIIFATTRSDVTSPSVNLVVASTLAQDYSWTSKLKIPHLRIIPIIADDPTATFHPPLNKGREAMMYVTYMYQFYDTLPDISIFIHGDDEAWYGYIPKRLFLPD
jgi:hypothetical protein